MSLKRFLTGNSMKFSTDLTIMQVKPAQRREVVLLITGLPFTTPDTQVKHYFEAFGVKFTDAEPIYGVYKEGPWRGQYNGERRYKADFSNQIIAMGSYHLINNTKVRIVYSGNMRTCWRCHQPPTFCPGDVLARVCGEKGGYRVTLSNHMARLWRKIKFSPGTNLHENDEISDGGLTPDLP